MIFRFARQLHVVFKNPKPNESLARGTPGLRSRALLPASKPMPALSSSILLALAALTCAAQARLLETTKECDARYGEGRELQLELGDGFKNEEGVKWSARLYSARGLAIQIVFENDVAALVRYSNEPPLKVANSITRPVNLTAEEVTHLRGMNLKEGISWKSHKDRTLEALSPSMTFWISSDKQSYASYDRDNRQLYVCSARFWDIAAGNLRKQAEASPAIRFEGL